MLITMNHVPCTALFTLALSYAFFPNLYLSLSYSVLLTVAVSQISRDTIILDAEAETVAF